MSFSDWSLFRNNTGTFSAVDSGSMPTHSPSMTLPIGTQSALMDNPNYLLGSMTNVLRAVGTAGVDWALTSGRIRCINFVSTFSSTHIGGIYFMADQADLANHTGNGYFVVYRRESLHKIQVIRNDSNKGVATFGGYPLGVDRSDVIGTTDVDFWADGVIQTIEVSWVLDLTVLGGVRVTVRIGSAIDFSDLTTVIDVIDEEEFALTSTVGEGFFGIARGGPSAWVIENVTISRLDNVPH